jgi:hypothetical protein
MGEHREQRLGTLGRRVLDAGWTLVVCRSVEQVGDSLLDAFLFGIVERLTERLPGPNDSSWCQPRYGP